MPQSVMFSTKHISKSLEFLSKQVARTWAEYNTMDSPFPSEAVFHSETSQIQTFLFAFLFACSFHTPLEWLPKLCWGYPRAMVAHNSLCLQTLPGVVTETAPLLRTVSPYLLDLSLWPHICLEGTNGKEELILGSQFKGMLCHNVKGLDGNGGGGKNRQKY